MLNTNPEITNAVKANTDAFLAMTKIAFASIEQLTALNLNTTRSSFEERAAAATSMLESNGAMHVSKTNKATPLAVSESATAYFRNVQNIATEAQDELRKLMTAYLASHSLQSGWLKGFDVFKGFGQPFAAFAEVNRKAMTDAASQLVNQTTLPSRKAA